MELSKIPKSIIDKLTHPNRSNTWEKTLSSASDTEQLWIESNKIKHNTVLLVRFNIAIVPNDTTFCLYAYLWIFGSELYITLVYLLGGMFNRYPLRQVLSSIEVVDSLDIVGVGL